jgi:hypothetical protein
MQTTRDFKLCAKYKAAKVDTLRIAAGPIALRGSDPRQHTLIKLDAGGDLRGLMHQPRDGSDFGRGANTKRPRSGHQNRSRPL